MSEYKSSVSPKKYYKEIGELWDTRDLSKFWDRPREAEFEVRIKSEKIDYAVDRNLSEKIQAMAAKRGVSGDTLLNLWVQEKLQEQGTR